jgi:hypothetical protein
MSRTAALAADEEVAMSPEQYQSHAHHFELLGVKTTSLGVREILFDIEAKWRQMAELDQAYLNTLMLPIMDGAVSRTPISGTTGRAISGWEPAFTGVPQVHDRRSASEEYKRTAAVLRELARRFRFPRALGGG